MTDTTTPPIALPTPADRSKSARALDTKSFAGKFLLFRKAGNALKRGGGAGGTEEAKTHRVRPPRFRHPSFAAAEAEAGRLLGLMPDSTFVILQEVARVKIVPTGENVNG
ncbi:hypothetical protein [Sphingomonas sp. Leaf242]|uniref:hypothetical protein n=1 Tax=Sphingomonas sp. Leaf242 TaxID=1736304 RepID=UPI0007122FD0|nr:hypothetical protein [Sphingomonas sp. Leaf242]KQO13254.1 hypothetical protein ASF09_03120 [Sphingomonas sp. Leaf242]